MPFIPVENTLLVELRQRLDGQAIENTLYFRKPAGAPTLSDAVTLANNLLVWWTTVLAPNLSNLLTLAEITVTDLSSATSFVHTQAAPVPNPTGAVAGHALPNNCALCVSFRTASRGRSFRGRNYVPGMTESGSESSRIDVVTAGLIVDAYQEVAQVAEDSLYLWVVVSRFTNNAPRVTGISTPITSVVLVDNVVDSQRRRLPGRGL